MKILDLMFEEYSKPKLFCSRKGRKILGSAGIAT
jgi:hypothetical protein